MPSVLISVYKPFETTCNGAIGQTTEDVLPAHTETKGEARRPTDLLCPADCTCPPAAPSMPSGSTGRVQPSTDTYPQPSPTS